MDLRGGIRQSRLDQRHGNARVFGQPGGQHTSRTARAHHYVVVHVDSFRLAITTANAPCRMTSAAS